MPIPPTDHHRFPCHRSAVVCSIIIHFIINNKYRMATTINDYYQRYVICLLCVCVLIILEWIIIIYKSDVSRRGFKLSFLSIIFIRKINLLYLLYFTFFPGSCIIRYFLLIFYHFQVFMIQRKTHIYYVHI